MKNLCLLNLKLFLVCVNTVFGKKLALGEGCKEISMNKSWRRYEEKGSGRQEGRMMKSERKTKTLR